ncbi:AfsA-related hotdog domain-containing protein [Polycladidibacter stylochi]|uniref:AfsA-related hotdog domain-containing protein n=1 Tax=Polycladidibacter stylochi TaxID=1807766 RepID=UPI00082D86B1|nr:AfsA-related hotdog domain-containing protein [Pseudovibrio stylochi]
MKVIVGDRFKNFADVAGAITSKQAIRELTRGSDHQGFMLGQGIHEQDAHVISVLAHALGLPCQTLEKDRHRAGRDVCHKHQVHNELISHPRKIEDGVFEADILIDDRNEIMSDHMTGCHLQGMLLIEAIRQMFIAVSETQYAHLGVPAGGYVVFNRLDIAFEQFAFPIATTVKQQVHSVTQPRPDRAVFAATLEVYQDKRRVAKTLVDYTVFEKASLKPKEEKLAQKAVEELLAQNAVPYIANEVNTNDMLAAG